MAFSSWQSQFCLSRLARSEVAECPWAWGSGEKLCPFPSQITRRRWSPNDPTADQDAPSSTNTITAPWVGLMGRRLCLKCVISLSARFTDSYLLSFHFIPHSVFRSRLPEQRVLQRDQAGLAYWKQMADQRQEGHGFMKRAWNMPGSCRGACPWTMAAWCERECVCVWVGIFVARDSKSQSVFF